MAFSENVIRSTGMCSGASSGPRRVSKKIMAAVFASLRIIGFGVAAIRALSSASVLALTMVSTRALCRETWGQGNLRSRGSSLSTLCRLTACLMCDQVRIQISVMALTWSSERMTSFPSMVCPFVLAVRPEASQGAGRTAGLPGTLHRSSNQYTRER